jgi:hypothetical protein
LERCIKFCVNHVTSERSFVVFSHGTCVIVDEPSDQPIEDATEILKDCAEPAAHFITRKIEHGDYLVTYRRPAFNCLFAEEIERMRPDLEANYLGYLTPEERASMRKDFVMSLDAKLGLVARARLNQDASDRVVAKVIRALPAQALPDGEEPVEPFGPPEPDPVRPPLPGQALPRIAPPLLPGA